MEMVLKIAKVILLKLKRHTIYESHAKIQNGHHAILFTYFVKKKERETKKRQREINNK